MTQALLTSELTPTISSRDVVELRNLHLNFREKHVLDDVSLSVAPQERLVIIGWAKAWLIAIRQWIRAPLKNRAAAKKSGR